MGREKWWSVGGCAEGQGRLNQDRKERKTSSDIFLILRHMHTWITNMDHGIQYECCLSLLSLVVSWRCDTFSGVCVCMRRQIHRMTFWKRQTFEGRNSTNYRQNLSGRYLHDKCAHRRTSSTSSLLLFFLLCLCYTDIPNMDCFHCIQLPIQPCTGFRMQTRQHRHDVPRSSKRLLVKCGWLIRRANRQSLEGESSL